MPLNCDCYAGCWGDHSEGWPEIQDTDDKYRAAAIGLLPYGTYVTMPGNVLRVQGADLVAKLEAEMSPSRDTKPEIR